ncbi:MAG: TIGR01777 family oxidoreductase [Planctomycetota bacterium]
MAWTGSYPLANDLECSIEGVALRIAITGSTGLVGTTLVRSLQSQGHTPIRLVRSKPQAGQIAWDPEAGTIDSASMEGLDAVVHLAGENIAAGRWNDARKRRIAESRVKGTSLLARTLAKLNSPPAVWVSASAIGYYGNRGNEILTEASAPGNGFLAEVCKDWEESTDAVKGTSIRLVNLRIGVVLSPEGGALAKMLLPFKMGAGGIVGPGTQYFSWVELGDIVRAIEFAIENPALSGPVNGTAPLPVTNREFTKALGRALHRPTIFPMPAFAARLAFGEMADEMLLASTRVEPAKLQKAGFVFRYPNIDGALKHLLG